MKKSPKLITSVQEIQEWRRSFQVSMDSSNIGLVPTMGALHLGHIELLRQIKKRCKISVLSIFVNPTQFGPQEDLSNYPRTFDQDLEIATQEGIDLVFAPKAEDLYPSDYSTFIEETSLSQTLCGVFRPGHFRGVTTIVLKLFNLIQPQLALFGYKDAQQFYVIQKMVSDLNLDILVDAIPTVREQDGLAISSRNRYLTTQERALAPLLYQKLCEIHDSIKKSGCIDNTHQLVEKIKIELLNHGFKIQYLKILEPPGLIEPVKNNEQLHTSLIISVAAILGKTRLIDNKPIHF